MTYDLIIKDALVVDPLNKIKRITSLGIKDGKIAAIDTLDGAKSRRYISFPNSILIPGIIDTHTHCSDWIGGHLAFNMLASAGVTTALDLAGPVEIVLELMHEYGSGINIAIAEALHPQKNIRDNNPSYQEIHGLLDNIIQKGAIGLKLIGGHYPLTVEASSNAIKAASDRQCYIAVHSGSIKNGSNLNGALDSISFSEGRPFHLAHINAYCRGTVMEDPKDELKLLLNALAANPQIISESHPATLNGTNGKCIKGVPESHVTRACLRMGGFPETATGIEEAFLAGYASCVVEDIDGQNGYLSGEQALLYWRSREQNAMCAFPVNNREIAFLCATAKDKNGKFIIDALSTDGGGIPRNYMIHHGYQLVEWGAWTIEEYVQKTSLAPAKMLGLKDKGHLTIGADADITVFDPVTRQAQLTVVKGEVVYIKGLITGNKGRVLCLPEGKAFVEKQGLIPEPVDLGGSLLYSSNKVD